jgi:hypothetical protein
MAIIVIAFICIGVAIWVARLNLPLRRSSAMLLCAALAIGLLDGLGFTYVAFQNEHTGFIDPRTGAFDSIYALKMFALGAVPAAVIAFTLAFFGWLVFRPIFGRKISSPE